MRNEELSDAIENLRYLSGILEDGAITESELDDIVKDIRKRGDIRKKAGRQRLKYDFMTWKPILWEKLKRIAGMNAFILLVVGVFAVSNLETYWSVPAIAMLTVGNLGMFTGLWISFKSWREYLRHLEKEVKEEEQE
ncbi:hypothetical protein 000TH008_69 [Bacillus phage 000TH008]|nr:hypothetical protein 000TH008_69 [Bacillus phage 000TH008]QQO40763.1 hypothetical protein 000TH009_69 [Bacillus phage 000TH009]